MENFANTRRRHRCHGEIRLLEKQMRPEAIERCLQFIDILIHRIIHSENLSPQHLFLPCQMHRSLVYQCQHKDISFYST